MENFWQDVRHGIRILTTNVGFTVIAVLTLALGIGANTAIFSVVNAVLLRPLPYHDSGRLVRLAQQGGPFRPGGGRGPRGSFVTSDTFEAWRASTKALDGLAAYSPRSYTLTGLGDPIRLRGTAVSAAMFPILGVTPQQGRAFSRAEEQPGADQVAVISDALWTRRFSRDPAIVGKPLMLDGQQVNVVGVAPADFYFPDRDTELWTPMRVTVTPQRPGQRMILAFGAIARVRPEFTISQAAAEGTTVAQHTQQDMPPGVMRGPEMTPASVRLVPLQEEMVAAVRPALFVLLGAVGFVLLIASANIANLLLARGAARQRELAVRTALGAQRGRLLRQLLTESVLLGLSGGLLGVLIAFGLQRLLRTVSPGNIPRIDEVTLDLRVLAFAAALSVVTGLLFGLAPALQGSRVNVIGALNEAGVQRMGGFRFLKGNRLRSLLVVAEVGLSIVLLAGAALLVRSFVRLIDVNPGYDPANVITAQVSLPPGRYGTPTAQQTFFDQLLERTSAIPGVKVAGTTNTLPLLPGSMIMSFGIDGRPEPSSPEDVPRASLHVVSAGYAEAIGLHLKSGRLLNAQDTPRTPTVVIVNETLARTYFPGGTAVGSHLHLMTPTEIVGVVDDVRHAGLDAEPQPEMYISFKQMGADRPGAPGGTVASLVVRAVGDPLALVPLLRQAVLDIDHDLPLDNVMTMDARLSASVAGPRFYALMLGLFALLALALAAVGIYGVLSYNVSQRHREIGVRMALGAEQRDILRLVVRQGLLLTMVGVALGIAGALAVTRLLTSLLFGIKPTDPIAYTGVSLLLVLVAFVACWVPARRATRLDPMVALRYE